MEIHQGVELPEEQSGRQGASYTVPVSVTISMLAVLVAGATLLGHRAHTEELLLQSHAVDRWSYYQAKNIREHQVQGFADLLATLAPQDKAKADALRQKYAAEAGRYGAEKGEINQEAQQLEAERDLAGRRADRFDGGEALLEVSLMICSITLLTRRAIFWFAGVAIGAMGVVFALTGFFLH